MDLTVMDRTKRFITEHYTYIVVMIVATLLMLVTLIIDKAYPFGDNFPLLGNGFIQDYTQFVNAANRVKSGGFFEFLEYGVGMTFDNYGMKTYSMTFLLLRPWLYIIYFFVPESLFLPVFFMYYYLNYLLAGPIFIYYLTHRRNAKVMDRKDPRLIAFGLCYGLSAFTISFFIYYFRYMIYMPIIFLGIEKLVYDKKSKLYIFTLAYFMATEAYYAFILCIFAAMYFLIQEHKDIKTFFMNGVRFAVSSMCAAGLSAAFLIPYFIRTRYSPYGEFDGEAPSLMKWFGSILSPLSEYRVAKDGMTTSSIEYRSNIYCGLLILLLVPVFMRLKDIKLSRRIKTLIFLAVIYIGFDNQLFNYIFHGFHYQWQVPNRFSSFFIFIILIMAYDVVLRFEEVGKKSMLVGVLVSAAVLLTSYVLGIDNPELPDSAVKYYICSFIFLGIYLIIFAGLYLKIDKKKCISILMTVVSIEVVFSSVFTLKSSMSFDGSKDEFAYIDNMKLLAERNPDMLIPYCITERPGETFDQNISYTTGTHSLSFYTSSSFSQHFDLYYRWGVLFSKNITYYTTGSPLADMMLHVRYHTINNEKYETVSPYVPIDMEGNVILYQNPYYLPLGIVIDSHVLDEWNKKSESYSNYSSVFERDNEFAHAFGVDDIYAELTAERINSEEELQAGTGNSLYYMVEEDAEGNALYTFYVDTDISGALYMQIAQASEYIGTAVEGETGVFYFYVPRTINIESQDDIKLAVFREDSFGQLYNILASNTAYNQSFDSDSISMDVQMPDNSMLYLAMPYLPGFTAYVDGQEAKITSYMDGAALYLNAGAHHIELKYTPEGVVTGWQISIITAMLMLVAYMLMIKKGVVQIEKKPDVKNVLIFTVLTLALLPMPIVFDGSGNYAFGNGWLLILIALIMGIRRRREIFGRIQKGRVQVAAVLLTVLFLIMLPFTDLIRGTALMTDSLLSSVWKWVLFVPSLIFSVWYIINAVLSCRFDKVKEYSPKLLKNRKVCLIIIAVLSCIFLFSAMPGIWIQDDVARVMLQIRSNAPSNWDTFGYYLYVYITTIGGRFQFGANIVQTIIFILINSYVLRALEKHSVKAMSVYTILMSVAVTPMLYLSVMYKDTVFAMGVLALTAGVFSVIRTGKVGKGDIAVLGFASLFVTLCRHGGYIASVSGLVILGIYLLKKNKAEIKRFIIAPVMHIMSYVLVYIILFNAMNVEPVPAYVKYGTPLSIISSAAYEGVEFDPEDEARLEEVMPVSDWGLCYDKYWADGISRPWGFLGSDNLFKMNDLMEEDGYGSFIIKLNAKLVFKHPVIFFRAFLGMANDIWEVSRPADMVEYYMPVSELAGLPEDSEIDYSGLYNLTKPVTEFYNDNTWLHTAFLRGGLSLFVCILLMTALFINKKKKYILPMIPVLLYSATLMLAIPAPDARYILPIMEAVIFMVAYFTGFKYRTVEESMSEKDSVEADVEKDGVEAKEETDSQDMADGEMNSQEIKN